MERPASRILARAPVSPRVAQRPFLVIENRFDVPPEYAIAWLTDFRSDDMQKVGGEKMPSIRVTRLPDGRIQREFSMMGLALTTRTTIQPPHDWIATMEGRDKKGEVVTTGRVVESVRPAGDGTHHRAELWDDGSRGYVRFFNWLSIPMQRAQLRKLFAQQKKEMEAAFRAGKPPTA